MNDGVNLELLEAISQHTGVPVSMLSGQTIADVWVSAQAAVDWANTSAPQPATAAVPVLPSQP